MKQAVVDLGTNTFHLLIANRRPDGTYQTLFRESRPAKLGKAGINQNRITPEAIDRALTVLRYFRQILDQHHVAPGHVVAIGTSAIRVAQNQTEFIERVRQETGIQIRVISGDDEAGYIYQGVRAAGGLDEQTALVMDIGGGSVEFIIGNAERVFWKQSFEIGGQRLLERFMPNPAEAISAGAIGRLHAFFREQLLPLANAIHQYQPTRLVGSSGTFDTLVDMQFQHERGAWPPREQTTFPLPLTEFYRQYERLISRNHDERLALPGMIELRVDMIVVAVCLIDYVLRTFAIGQLQTSTYALKEGVLATLMPPDA